MLITKANIDRNALQGQVGIVTGAGQGIGRETARALAYLGAEVIIAELNDTGHDTERIILAEGGRALFVRTDVADAESVERLRERVQADFGKVDILVNNAETYRAKAVLEHSLAEWDRVIAVNLRAIFLAVKAFLPGMLERRTGVIVAMPSTEGMPYLSAYLAAKVGARSFMLSLAQEIGAESGVSVYLFGAGMVETPGGMAAFQELAPRYGLSLEEFIRQSGGELLSAEACAAGLVGTILHASEYHGELTGYGSGLGKLGLLADGRRLAELPAAPEPVPSVTAVPAPAAQQSPLAEALALNQELEGIIAAIAKEYAELTLFQRPIVKRMFQQGTGLSVEDWLTSASDMGRLLQAAAQGEAAPPVERLRDYATRLRRLAAYHQKQEADARGWFKDPEKLRVALEALRARRRTSEELADTLEGLASQSPNG
jgi:NAD(P)-dependent dehydrogenase (short-subunit alcohol dehydrogenase family)